MGNSLRRDCRELGTKAGLMEKAIRKPELLQAPRFGFQSVRNLDEPQQAAMSLAHEAMSRWQARGPEPGFQTGSLKPKLPKP